MARVGYSWPWAASEHLALGTEGAGQAPGHPPMDVLLFGAGVLLELVHQLLDGLDGLTM